MGALAAVLASVAYIAWILGVAFGTPSFYGVTVSDIALVCTLGGLVGLHTLQETSYGRLGLAGFFSAFVGTALILQSTPFRPGGREVLEAVLAIGLLGVIVGVVLLGVSTLRARVLPRWCGLLLILGLPLVAISAAAFSFLILALGPVAANSGQVSTGITLGLIWLALGYALWRQQEEEAPEDMASQSPGASAFPETR